MVVLRRLVFREENFNVKTDREPCRSTSVEPLMLIQFYGSEMAAEPRAPTMIAICTRDLNHPKTSCTRQPYYLVEIEVLTPQNS